MEILVNRIKPPNLEVKSMLGMVTINGNHYGASLEDVYRNGFKIPGVTAVAPGRYEIKPDRESARGRYYSQKYEWHRYALELQDVPNYTDILLHPVRTHMNTEGCIGLGDQPYLNWKTGEWEMIPDIEAYKRISLMCYECFDNGEKVWITIQ